MDEKGEMAVADGIWFAGKTIMNFASHTLQEQVKTSHSLLV